MDTWKKVLASYLIRVTIEHLKVNIRIPQLERTLVPSREGKLCSSLGIFSLNNPREKSRKKKSDFYKTHACQRYLISQWGNQKRCSNQFKGEFKDQIYKLMRFVEIYSPNRDNTGFYGGGREGNWASRWCILHAYRYLQYYKFSAISLSRVAV